MRSLLSVVLMLVFISTTNFSFGWGMIGHRVVGEIASRHINSKTEAEIKRVLGNKTLAQVANYLDDVKSDPAVRFDTLNAYHYVSVNDGLTYAETNINPKGDAIVGLNTAIAKLKSGQLSLEDEQFYLKIVIHLVGDLHQPLHVGRVEDKGGNTINVSWFGKRSNLHKVWDSEILDGKLYSYTELTALIDHATAEDVTRLQSATLDDWISESQALRPLIYGFEEARNWEYKYMYHIWPVMQEQLMKGGVRLAGILDDIYGH